MAEVTRQLAGSGPDFSFSDRGRLRLKGFPERWRLYALGWESKDPGTPIHERTPYVGRQAERTELRRLLALAVRGAGGLVMVGGEPGVGKTRLAEELMAEASREGVAVFAGHSYEMEGAAPFIAVVEILEAALAQAPSPQAFRSFLGEQAPEVARLLPELRRLCPDIPPPLQLPAEQERRLLFNSIREVIARSARRRPVLLVFDDLHWADDPTLLLVEHLADGLSELPVLMVATYRETEVDVGRPLAKTFDDLRRRQLARWISLTRLPEDDVAQLLRALSGQEPPPVVVQAIYSETEGNPFFFVEVYRHLVEEGRLFDASGRFRSGLVIADLDVPASVRLAVGRRLERLGEAVRRVLIQAAIVGRAFSVEVLEAMQDADPDALLDVIENAEQARLIVPAPDPSGEDRFIFAHELIRQTLLADLSLTRRRRLHARTADALERHYDAHLDRQAATIAYHLLEAETAGDVDRAYRYLVRAGRWAMDGGAFEEALRHYERASTLQQVAGPAERAALLGDLGDARRCAGHWDTAIDAWRQSADIYAELGDAEGAGRVCEAAAYNLVWAGRILEGVEIAERGLRALGERVSADRARLLGTAAFPAAFAGQYEVSAGMTDEALALAGQLGDDALLGHVLAHKALAHWGFLEHREAVEAGVRAADLLRGTADLWGLSVVLGFLLVSLTSLGRFDETLTMDEELTPLAERIGNHGALMQHRRMKGLINFFRSGDVDQLEAFAYEDRTFCEAAGLPWVASDWSWLGWAQFLRGDWDEARSLFRHAVEIEPPGGLQGWNASLLFECLAYRGEKGRALAVLEGRALPGPGEPKLWGPTSMLLSAVEGLTVLGEREHAAGLYPSVIDVFDRTRVACLPYDDGRLVLRAAGIAAAAGQRWVEAEDHFEAALRQAAELPHRLEEAHTRRWYGRMLLDRSGSGDRERGGHLLEAAMADYERMGLRRHCDLAATALAEG